jgi:hypothetical protein
MASLGCHSIHPCSIFLHWVALRARYVSCLLSQTRLGHAIDPCSPRWLLEKGRSEEAEKALVYLRGAEDRPEDIQPELQDIKQNIESNNSITEASWSELERRLTPIHGTDVRRDSDQVLSPYRLPCAWPVKGSEFDGEWNREYTEDWMHDH